MNQTTIQFEACGGAAERFDCTDGKVLYVGPKDTGKTRADCEWTDMMCHLYPGSRHLWVRDTRVSLTDTTLNTFERDVVDWAAIANPEASRGGRRVYAYKNGSEIILQGLDKIGRGQGGEYDSITIFEATVGVTREAFEELSGWCTGRGAVMPFTQIIAECNPSSPSHWLIKMAAKGELKHIKARFTDNPTITKERIDWLKALTGHRRARWYLGEWAALEGLVYPNLLDCVRPLEKDPVGYKFGGIDWGWEHPFAAVWGVYWIESGGPRVHIQGERYKSQCWVEEHVKHLPKGYEWKPDPSLPSEIEKMRNLGYNVEKADNSIIPGVAGVNKWIESGNLTISPDCVNLIKEAEGYIWDKAEKPVTVLNDAMDALRYAIRGLDARLNISKAFDGLKGDGGRSVRHVRQGVKGY